MRKWPLEVGLIPCLPLAIGLAAGACDRLSTDPSTPTPSAGVAMPSGSVIPIPPSVLPRLTEVRNELADLICMRSQNCCGQYGFKPLSDCTSFASDLLTTQLIFASATEDVSDMWIDERFVTACLDAARSVANKCVFTGESSGDILGFAWDPACDQVLQFDPQDAGDFPCGTDTECAIEFDAGYACLGLRCVPIVPVGNDASCEQIADAIDPLCEPGQWCDPSTNFCAPTVSVGQTCGGWNEACGDGYYCLSQAAGDSTCAPQVGPGGVAQDPAGCMPGLVWTGTGDESGICYGVAAWGEACNSVFRCGEDCDGGICLPSSIPFCQPP